MRRHGVGAVSALNLLKKISAIGGAKGRDATNSTAPMTASHRFSATTRRNVLMRALSKYLRQETKDSALSEFTLHLRGLFYLRSHRKSNPGFRRERATS